MTINVSKIVRAGLAILTLIASNFLYQAIKSALGFDVSITEALERSYFQACAILTYAYFFENN